VPRSICAQTAHANRNVRIAEERSDRRDCGIAAVVAVGVFMDIFLFISVEP
jgi:hypothetical protein